MRWQRSAHFLQFAPLLRAALFVAAPASYILVENLRTTTGAPVGEPDLFGAATAACFLAAGIAVTRSRRFGRLLAGAGTIGVAWIGRKAWMASPALTLLSSILVGAALAGLFLTLRAPSSLLPLALRRRRDVSVPLRVASAAALVVWFASIPAEMARTASAQFAVLLALLVPIGYGLVWIFQSDLRRLLRGIFAAILLIVPAIVFVARPDPTIAASVLTLPALALFFGARHEALPGEIGWLQRLAEHPSRLLVTTFFLLCSVGAVLLSLPVAGTAADRIGWIDAAFTAVSAVCVTGLIVLDTPNDFTGFGQAVLFLLMQAGGLGIMAFYAASLPMLGRALSLRHERALASALSIEDRSQLFSALGRVLAVTFIAEGLGAVALLIAFTSGGEAFGSALWRAAFTAVSAFCNAGFALQSESLVPYQDNPAVLATVSTLIVVGGLAPPAVVAIPSLFRRARRIRLQTKLALAMTAILLATGMLLFAFLEWTSSLAHLPFGDRLVNAFFQSATLRTAGFNSVDMGALQPVTRSLMVVWMFIGGNAGSTAGGVKTTTIAVLLLAVVAAIRGRTEATIFGRRIGHTTIYKAAAVATLGIASAVVAINAILATQVMPSEMALFEVISALGTVGLSIGGTERLDEVGKIIIMACMFVGRVGPLTTFLFLLGRRAEVPYKLPPEEVEVG